MRFSKCRKSEPQVAASIPVGEAKRQRLWVPPTYENPVSSGRGRRAQVAGLVPVEDEVALREIPGLFDFREDVEVSDRSDHDLATARFCENVMSNRVALTGGGFSDDGDRALSIEVSGRLIAIEIVEYLSPRFVLHPSRQRSEYRP
jgi:hypothetical protein